MASLHIDPMTMLDSLTMSPVTMLIFDLLALGWLCLVWLWGWFWMEYSKPWHSNVVSWQRVLVVSFVQGFLGAQIALGFSLESLNQAFPPTFLPWLAGPAAVLFRLLTVPFSIARELFPAAEPSIWLVALFYTAIFLAVNNLGVGIERLRESPEER